MQDANKSENREANSSHEHSGSLKLVRMIRHAAESTCERVSNLFGRFNRLLGIDDTEKDFATRVFNAMMPVALIGLGTLGVSAVVGTVAVGAAFTILSAGTAATGLVVGAGVVGVAATLVSAVAEKFENNISSSLGQKCQLEAVVEAAAPRSEVNYSPAAFKSLDLSKVFSDESGQNVTVSASAKNSLSGPRPKNYEL